MQHPPGRGSGQVVVNPPMTDLLRSGKRRRIVRVERDLGRERRTGLGGEQTPLVLQMHREVVLVPEHQVAASVQVVVHLVDAAALVPGTVPVAIAAVDPLRPARGADGHRIGERPAAPLDEHMEGVVLRHDQLVAVVAVQVARDVHMDNLTPPRRFEVGLHRSELPLRL